MLYIAHTLICLTVSFGLPNHKHVGGNDTYGINRIPTTVGRREVVERAGLGASTKIVYPGSGHEDA